MNDEEYRNDKLFDEEYKKTKWMIWSEHFLYQFISNTYYSIKSNIR